MCRHRKEKKIRKEFKNILKQRRALRRERQQRENLVNLDLLCVFPSFEHHPRNTPDSLRIIKRFFPPQKFVRVMHSQRGWKRERKHLITDFCDDAFEKQQKEKFHENTFEKVFASEKIIMKGKKMLFISKTHQQRKFYESLLTPLWFSQFSAFPSRCSPAVVYWWLHFSLFFSVYDSFRIFSLFIPILWYFLHRTMIFLTCEKLVSEKKSLKICFCRQLRVIQQYGLWLVAASLMLVLWKALPWKRKHALA